MDFSAEKSCHEPKNPLGSEMRIDRPVAQAIELASINRWNDRVRNRKN
jgi:hypothetical protein